jgi:hypothetical protein
MGNELDNALSQAFDLIEADRLDEARLLLKPILETDKDNVDVWWLYAHAVTDPETARLALHNVQRLDPTYLNANELLYSLDAQSTSDMSVITSSDKDPSFLPTVPATLPGLPGYKAASGQDKGSDPIEGTTDVLPLYRRPVFLLGIGSIIFVIIAALVILRPSVEGESVMVTPVATTSQNVENPTAIIQPTVEEVTVTNQDVPTSTAAIRVDAEIYRDLATALADFNIAEGGIAIEETSLGDTLVVSICTQAGKRLRDTLPEVIMAVAKQVHVIPEAQGIGIRMLDCEGESTLLIVGAKVDDIQAYNSGDLSQETFQAKWQPIG